MTSITLLRNPIQPLLAIKKYIYQAEFLNTPGILFLVWEHHDHRVKDHKTFICPVLQKCSKFLVYSFSIYSPLTLPCRLDCSRWRLHLNVVLSGCLFSSNTYLLKQDGHQASDHSSPQKIDRISAQWPNYSVNMVLGITLICVHNLVDAHPN